MVDNRPRYRVPDELRETLLDFTIAYLLERPPNLIDFGIQFFQRLKTERESSAAAGPSSAGRQSQLNGQRQQNEVDDEGEQLNPPPLKEADSSKINVTLPVSRNASSTNASAAFKDLLQERLAFRLALSEGDAGEIAKMGAGEVYTLEEVDATWIFHLAARWVLEQPKDIVEWGLNYCENEKLRWAYK